MRRALIYSATIYIALSLCFGLILYSDRQKINSLQESLRVLQSNYDVMQNNFKALQTSLEAQKQVNRKVVEENARIEQTNAQLEQTNIQVASDSEKVQKEVDEARDELAQFETTVRESISWFRENNNIRNLTIYDELKQDLQQCITSDGRCVIDVSCIYAVGDANHFRYRYDEATTGKGDFLKDLTMIYQQYGGDCEDISLLYRAGYNYLKEQCSFSYPGQSILVRNEGESAIDGNNMYILCGSFDPKERVTDFAGHCLVALTPIEINSSQDIHRSLSRSTLVEPQTGKIVAHLNESDVITVFDNNVVPDTLYRAWMVITDDDLYIFYEYTEEIEWKGYGDFLTDIDILVERVDNAE